MKKEKFLIDATPSKRLYYSIIADYDLNKSICELVDNAIDIWFKNGEKKRLIVEIKPKLDQQIILVKDNAGGIGKNELKYIIAPGHTSNKPDEVTIGFFGVGSKRAVVALAQDIVITTRHKNNQTYQLNVQEEWFKDDSWDIPVYSVSDVDPNSTFVELRKLRFQLKTEDIDNLIDYLSATYAKYIQKGVTIKIGNYLIRRLYKLK